MSQLVLKVPQEIFDLIALNLDFDTILSLRCTCHFFLKATSSFKIWATCAQELQLDPRITKLEEPILDYTALELKDWVLRRYNAQEMIHVDPDMVAQFKKRGELRSGVGEVELLPGGRWLLFIRGSDMFFVDCDAATLEPQTLISTEAPMQGTLLRFKTWFDRDAPRLTFRVAMIHWEKMKRDLSERQFWVTFYNVNLVGHGSTAKLVSETLSPGRRWSRSIIHNTHFEALNKDHFILVKATADAENLVFDRELSLHVIDYMDPSPSVDFYGVFLGSVSLPVFDMWMLPGNRFAVCDMDHLLIYRIPKKGVEDLTPLHTLKDMRVQFTQVSTYFRSGLYVDENSTTVIYRGRASTRMLQAVARTGVQIPHDDSKEPRVWSIRADADKTPPNAGAPLFVSLGGTVVILKDRAGMRCTWVFNIPWWEPVESDDVIVKGFEIPGVCGDRIRAFDEGIGRMVLQGSTFGDTAVFDLVHSSA